MPVIKTQSIKPIKPIKRKQRILPKIAHYPDEYVSPKGQIKIPEWMREAVFKIFGRECYSCGYPGTDGKGKHLHMDREDPNYPHTVDNLKPLCRHHHGLLGAKRKSNPFILMTAALGMPRIGVKIPGGLR